MKIISMTATFGKLSHQTLTLQPGLNVIHAPNEWGKSTWCAFLCAMLYGIDTRERTTQTALADKERYAPWSGEPMSGKIDLEWKGKKITIERRTKGRVPMGEFRAYETESGLPVAQLTAENCGEVLLGVEKTVFLRSAFIRQSSMPVSADEALRRRLNALVTTGDENDAADALAQSLRDLKNKCRHNKTGLLPQAEAERNALTQKLEQLRTLRSQAHSLEQRQAQLAQRIQSLKNHQAALAYEAAQADLQKVEAARETARLAEEACRQLEEECAQLPSLETAQQTILHLEQLQIQQDDLRSESQPTAPVKPDVPLIFAGMTPEQAVAQTKADEEAYDRLNRPVSPLFLILAAVGMVAAVGLAFAHILAAIPGAVLAVLFLVLHFAKKSDQEKAKQSILVRYPGLVPGTWQKIAENYYHQAADYAQQEAIYRAAVEGQHSRKAALSENIAHFTYGGTISETIAGWRETVDLHKALENARQNQYQTRQHADALMSMLKEVAPPALPDELTYTQAQTDAMLAETAGEHRQLHLRLGQYLGQMEVLGQESVLEKQLVAVQNRIERLEMTYKALELAQKNLAEASEDLQRRFAPMIAQRAQALFSKFTGSRYNRLQLSRDLSVHAGAEGEDTLHTALWRSDGTADQLYLALRLAVAEELIPNATLVLDDAFVRFDDDRLAKALAVLKEYASSRQVILFTCQEREQTILSQ